MSESRKFEANIYGWILLVIEPFILLWLWRWFLETPTGLRLTWTAVFGLNLVVTVLVGLDHDMSDAARIERGKRLLARVFSVLIVAAAVHFIPKMFR